MTDGLLRASGVGRRYGSRVALEPTDLEVVAGEAVALVGPNGAGKSTLLSLLAGALPASEGRVASSGRIGWAPQRPAVYRHLSARENRVLFGRLEGVSDAAAEADRLLAAVGLDGREGPARRLSVGMLQRLNIAVALLGDPDVLLLDEPTASLDPEQRARVWEVAGAIRARGGAVVFSTHDLADLGAQASRVIALGDGRVLFDGDPAAFEAGA